MIRNYLSETDLKSLIPNLDSLLFSEDDNWDRQKEKAEDKVKNDFLKSKYRAVYLRNDYSLRASGTVLSSSTTGTETSDEELLSRSRWIVNCTTYTGTAKTLTLKGSNDGDTWTTITTQSISATGETSVIIGKNFKYYRVDATVSSGTIDFESSLTETVYDILYRLQWAAEIYFVCFRNADDQYYLKYQECLKQYAEEFNKVIVYYDYDGSGEVDTYEYASQSTLQMLK